MRYTLRSAHHFDKPRGRWALQQEVESGANLEGILICQVQMSIRMPRYLAFRVVILDNKTGLQLPLHKVLIPCNYWHRSAKVYPGSASNSLVLLRYILVLASLFRISLTVVWFG